MTKPRTQEKCGEAVRSRNSHCTRKLDVGLGEIALRSQQLGFYFFGCLVQSIAGGGQHASGSMPIEQAHAKGLLKRVDPADDRSVIDPQLQRRGRKLACASDAQEDAYIVPVYLKIGVPIHRAVQPSQAT